MTSGVNIGKEMQRISGQVEKKNAFLVQQTMINRKQNVK